jgi:hypothetical protein
MVKSINFILFTYVLLGSASAFAQNVKHNPKEAFETHGLRGIKVTKVTGADSLHAKGIKGRGKVAIIDENFTPKDISFLQAKKLLHSATTRLSTAALTQTEAIPLDEEMGHGTGVMHTFHSVAPETEILPIDVRYMEHKNKSIHPMAHAIDIAIKEKVDAISLSISPDDTDPEYVNALVRAINNNIPIFYAAGNYSKPGAPAILDTIKSRSTGKMIPQNEMVAFERAGKKGILFALAIGLDHKGEEIFTDFSVHPSVNSESHAVATIGQEIPVPGDLFGGTSGSAPIFSASYMLLKQYMQSLNHWESPHSLLKEIHDSGHDLTHQYVGTPLKTYKVLDLNKAMQRMSARVEPPTIIDFDYQSVSFSQLSANEVHFSFNNTKTGQVVSKQLTLPEDYGMRLRGNKLVVEQHAPLFEVIDNTKNIQIQIVRGVDSIAIQKSTGLEHFGLFSYNTVNYPGQLEEMPSLAISAPKLVNAGTLKAKTFQFHGKDVENFGHIISPNPMMVNSVGTMIFNEGLIKVPEVIGKDVRYRDLKFDYETLLVSVLDSNKVQVSLKNVPKKVNLDYTFTVEEGYGIKWEKGKLVLAKDSPLLNILIPESDINIQMTKYSNNLAIIKSIGMKHIGVQSYLDVLYPGQLEEIPRLDISAPKLTNIGTLKATELRFHGDEIENVGHIISSNPVNLTRSGTMILNEGLLKVPQFKGKDHFISDVNFNFDKVSIEVTGENSVNVSLDNSKANQGIDYSFEVPEGYGIKWERGKLIVVKGAPFLEIKDKNTHLLLGKLKDNVSIIKSTGISAFNLDSYIPVYYPGQLEEIPSLSVSAPKLTNAGTLSAKNLEFHGGVIENLGHILSPNPLYLGNKGTVVQNKGLIKVPK